MLKTVSKYIKDVYLVLEINDKSTLLTLYLENTDKFDIIKNALIDKFPEDIEQIGFENKGNWIAMNILDFFYEFNE